MSQEYISALVIALGAALKIFGIVEIENKTIEAIVAGVIAVWIAIRRHSRGDINVVGMKVDAVS